MKNIILLTSFLLLIFIYPLKAQMELFVPDGDMPNMNNYSQIGGLALPNSGTLNVLVVFAQFPDDEYQVNSSQWPKGGQPYDRNNWVDQTWTGNPTPYSLTDYFNQMSLGQLHFIGKTDTITTPHTRQWYYDNLKNRTYIHKEITEQLDIRWDFSQFDNWKRTSYYNFLHEPDGQIDFVIFIWRNVASELNDPSDYIGRLNINNYGSVAWSGYNIYQYNVDDGARWVKLGDYQSGVTLRDYLSLSRDETFKFTIHETAHYFLGGNEFHNGQGFWAMLCHYGNRFYTINAYERYRIGWGNVLTIPYNQYTHYNLSLPDFITTGVAYRVEVDPSTGKCFYIENHQKISRWDAATSYKYPDDKGVFIMRQEYLSSQIGDVSDWMHLLPAEGRFNWSVLGWEPSLWGNENLPVFRRGIQNRETGYTPLEPIPVYNPNYEEREIIYQALPNYQPHVLGTWIVDPSREGKGKDAFRIGYSQVFSPWSNPSSQNKDRSASGIGLKVNSVNNGIYDINIYVGTAINAPPSKPINFQVQPSAANHPKLTWTLNTEPDMSSYKIYKKITSEQGWYLLTTISSSVNNYEDVTETCVTGPPVANEYLIKYKVSAVDNQALESVASDEVNNRVKGAPLEKKGNTSKDLLNALGDNYPNPFNPTTIISYTIPHIKDNADGGGEVVTLKVYDLLGNEVATLVNKELPAGSYTAEFSAAGLSSGVYIYTLKAGSYTQSKKMQVIK